MTPLYWDSILILQVGLPLSIVLQAIKLNLTLFVVGSKLDQVWSILPALELLPLHSLRRGVNSGGGATPMQAQWIKLDLGTSWIN